MKQLTETQCCQVAGGFAGLQSIAISASIGGSWDMGSYYLSAKKPSVAGMIYAGAFGALTGAATSALIIASGGGIIAHTAHRPGMTALNWSIQHVAPGRN